MAYYEDYIQRKAEQAFDQEKAKFALYDSDKGGEFTRQREKEKPLMEYESSRIIDNNAQKYRIGWDEYGLFSIEAVEQHPETGEWVKMEDYAIHSFTPDGTEELIEAIEEGQ